MPFLIEKVKKKEMTKNLDKNMNLYELTYLITPKKTSDETEKFNKKIISLLKEAGATLYKMNDPKKRKLAYKINNFGEAYLASIDLDIGSEKIKIIEEKLKRESDILRFLIISKDKLEEEKEEKGMNKKIKDTDKEKDKEKVKKEKVKKEKDKKSKKEDKVKLNEIDKKIDEIL